MSASTAAVIGAVDGDAVAGIEEAELVLGAARSQSRRRGADVPTINRPDTPLPIPLAMKTRKGETSSLFQSPRRQSDYQGYRGAPPDRAASSMPILIGAAMIAAAILLSTLVTAVGTRFVGIDSPTEETMWLVDRLTGNVYRCQAAERGKASCEPDIATGSVGDRPKQ
jgi:hypothetical protein